MTFTSFFLAGLLGVCATAATLAGPSPSAGNSGERSRILFIPLDDRPPCLQWPVLMGKTAGTELVAPPRELLGRFVSPGDPERISDWIDSEDSDAFDAAIVSLDMLAYGGLVASRVYQVDTGRSIERLNVLENLRRARPDLPIYGFSIVMRLAPTADGTNDAWRGALARWAELWPERNASEEIAGEVRRLEERIPTEVLADYKRTRARNLAVNRAAIGLVESGILSFLVLGQDDAKLRGVHVADRKALLAGIEASGASDLMVFQPGADEVAMLLLSRALRDRAGTTPAIKAVYSSETARTIVTPFEDRSLHETVSLQIAAAGGKETFSASEADLVFYVFASRHEDGVAPGFAGAIADAVSRGQRAIVTDIDTRGDVQGGSQEFTEALLATGAFSRLFGYASWNTAGNTIGTALPQGILGLLSGDQPESDRKEFLRHRLINDYAYHGLVRPGINREYARERGMNTLRLTPEESTHLEEVITARLAPHAERLGKALELPGALGDLRLRLPWNRTFEAEIEFSPKD